MSAGRPEKQTIVDLARYMGKGVQVKLGGGRQVTGILRGYDQLLNLVLEDAVETLRDVEDHTVLTRTERKLGTTVCRGTSVMVVSLSDGLQEVANPFSE